MHNDLVDKTLGSFVVTAWEKHKTLLLDIRKKTPDPYLAEYFQWLAERIDETMKKTSRKPFFEANPRTSPEDKTPSPFDDDSHVIYHSDIDTRYRGGFMARSHNQKIDLLRGTLDMMILRILDLKPLHGIAIADRIRLSTKGAFTIQAGSLFPALHRLEQEGWIAGAWTTNEQARRIKSYRLTAAGKRQLSEERRTWERIVTAVTQVMETS